ncbi:MAG: pseudouridine-5'-phosphate glycosidase [Planctomycetaceae bacterium]|nr:pseudouridine-5'-phosphate glycosidase [Planctomycetaceae bacterium]
MGTETGPSRWGAEVAGPLPDCPHVFLESTVIAQGLPWPENLETGLAMEAAVRQAGAQPLTIAMFQGAVRMGLATSELEQIARSALTSPNPEPTRGGTSATAQLTPHCFSKANRRDLAATIARGNSAATTVSATLFLARRYGKNPCIMATGGLGGVHRAAAETYDVSTDLDELARADGCLVVCSGFKSILDLPGTLEALETRGIAIVGYRTSELPAFTTVSSGLPLEHRVDSPQEAADLVRAHRELRLPGAIVLTNPVPEAQALGRPLTEAVLEKAIEEARKRNVTGKAVTPFLLEKIRQATGGQSLRANCALLVANARIAAEVAVELEQLEAGPAPSHKVSSE